MAGNGPVNTSPVYATDELVYIRARGDYGQLTGASEQLAAGNDGVITSGSPWTMTSISVDFNAQGLAAQNIVQLTAPKSGFPGSGRFFAIDTVSPNTVTLRVVGKAPGVGQPPAPAGLTGITFVCNTFASMIENASWDLKDRHEIDEVIPFRASPWIYEGSEDPYRVLREACVLQVLVKAFQSDVRSKEGDWAMKLKNFKEEYGQVLDRVRILWGPFGNSAEPTTRFSCQLSR